MPSVEFYTDGPLGRVILNRPHALNALTHDMVICLSKQLGDWAMDPKVKAVVVEGAGEKAFCAGGDIRAMAEASAQNRFTFVRDFFADEYLLNKRIKNFPKPYIALMDGITMGGGAGISIHGSHRVATKRTVFAMPETGIGFFPDVGATDFLPCLPGAFGMYLALTGARVYGQDNVSLGLATHYIPHHVWGECVTTLAKALDQTTEPASVKSRVCEVLGQFSKSVDGCAGLSLAETKESVDRCFIERSVIDITRSLQEEGTPWAQTCYASFRKHSPTSLHVTFEQMHFGATLKSFDDVICLEYRLALRLAYGPDFIEGVRAALIDKDHAPRWTPACLEDILSADIKSYFDPAEQEDFLLCRANLCN